MLHETLDLKCSIFYWTSNPSSIHCDEATGLLHKDLGGEGKM